MCLKGTRVARHDLGHNFPDGWPPLDTEDVLRKVKVPLYRPDPLMLAWRQNLDRVADCDPVKRHHRVRRQCGADVDDPIDPHRRPCTYPSAVKHCRSGREKSVVLDLAASEISAWPDEDVVPNPHRIAFQPADSRRIHDDTVAADRDRAALGCKHGAEADRTVRTDRDLTTEDGVRGNAGSRIDFRSGAIVFQKHEVLHR